MSYLEYKKIAHMDLASRNCLIDFDCQKVKVADFGLARRVQSEADGRLGINCDLLSYYKSKFHRLIFHTEGSSLACGRWMPPEYHRDYIFTCKSDAWSYGILLWEMLTLGERPYGVSFIFLNKRTMDKYN